MGTRLEYFQIHNALHDVETSSVVIDNKDLKIRYSKGFRYVVVGSNVFSQQDTSKKTNLARRAKTERITRIIRSGRKWGWISDTEIADPLLQEPNEQGTVSAGTHSKV